MIIRRFSMGREINADSIRALEKQILEGDGDTVKLKRARNSLLNISTRVPPEILGSIFVWAVAREQNYSPYALTHFRGLERGSYNFLLVCHHWFEVASSAPELWNFWGNTVQQWEKQHHRTGAASIDLVLNKFAIDRPVLSTPLQNALRNLAAQDKIRRIHLHLAGDDPNPLPSILSHLTPDEEGPQEKRIESIILRSNFITDELSNFFARSHLPKLQCLQISGILENPLWGHSKTLQTTHLTTLSLQISQPSPAMAASQLISTLVSNPNLQYLALWYSALPDMGESGPRVPLRHLRTIALAGDFRTVFLLLQQLELPPTLDYTSFILNNSTVEDVSQTLIPYVRGHFQRDIRFKDKLEVVASFWGFIEIFVGPVDGAPEQTPQSQADLRWPSASFSVNMVDPILPGSLVVKLRLDFMALIPQEHIVSLDMDYSFEVPDELFIAMPNIEILGLSKVTLSDGFLQPSPDGPYAGTKLFPSLRSLSLEDFTVEDDNWEPLTTYLAHQTSSGQVISLDVSSEHTLVPPEVKKRIQELVEEFTSCVYDSSSSEDNLDSEEDDHME